MPRNVWHFITGYLLYTRRERAFWRFNHAFLEAVNQGVIIEAHAKFHKDFHHWTEAIAEHVKEHRKTRDKGESKDG